MARRAAKVDRSGELMGEVFDIERYAIHDGPGIRSVVFMKGCPLRCLWCQNPEGQAKGRELMYFNNKCIGCKRCLAACSRKALTFDGEGLKVDKKLCVSCGCCEKVCCSQALKSVGKKMTVQQALKAVERDLSFYNNTEGGVTISGGEPLLQPEFVLELLKSCKGNYIHTALETCGFVKWEHLEKTLDYLDWLFFDLKAISPEKHQKLTGVSNEIILDNLQKLAGVRIPLVVRIPVVPGCNDDQREIGGIVKFVKEKVKNVNVIELMPYHTLGETKYKTLGMDYELKGLKPLVEEEVKPFKEIVEGYGFKTEY